MVDSYTDTNKFLEVAVDDFFNLGGSKIITSSSIPPAQVNEPGECKGSEYVTCLSYYK